MASISFWELILLLSSVVYLGDSVLYNFLGIVSFFFKYRIFITQFLVVLKTRISLFISIIKLFPPYACLTICLYAICRTDFFVSTSLLGVLDALDSISSLNFSDHY
jgi:hypothetical protein